MKLPTTTMLWITAALISVNCLPFSTDPDEPGIEVAKLTPVRHEGSAYDQACPTDIVNPGEYVNLNVLYPNGGESFRVGDTVVIGVCMKDVSYENLMDANLELVVGKDWASVELRNPLVTDGPLLERFEWIIPDSLEVLVIRKGEYQKISAVGDTFSIGVSDYEEAMDRDQSDGYFRILPKL